MTKDEVVEMARSSGSRDPLDWLAGAYLVVMDTHRALRVERAELAVRCSQLAWETERLREELVHLRMDVR